MLGLSASTNEMSAHILAPWEPVVTASSTPDGGCNARVVRPPSGGGLLLLGNHSERPSVGSRH